MLAMILSVSSSEVRAHEPGNTRVSIQVEADGHVGVRVPAIASLLVPLLDATGDTGRAAPTEGAEGALMARKELWLRTVSLRADGREVPLSFAWEPAPDSSVAGEGHGTIVLSGFLPPDARELVWQYRIPVGAYPVQVTAPGLDKPVVVWAVGDRASDPIRFEVSSRWTLVRRYFELGVVHIVPRGLDHILFVLGLFLLRRSWRPLLAQVSAFTIAHTVTLGASVAGLVSLPSTIVEPLIGASVAWIAIENVWRTSVSRARVGAVFLCGLLHGLGFAGVLAGLGLPSGARAVALVSFNAGVELGQILVLLVAFAATAWMASDSRRYRRWVVVPASLCIAAVGVYWTLARIGGV